MLLDESGPEITSILGFSVFVSAISTAIATAIGIPLGIFLGTHEFKGKTIIVNITNSFMGFPPVVMGVLIYLLLSTSGPLGLLRLLYTPIAIIIAQTLLCLPIITGLTTSACANHHKPIADTVLALGGTKMDVYDSILSECSIPILSGVMIGFGQAISEVGASQIVGGNIRYSTRTITTAIVFYTSMGDSGTALLLGGILLIAVFMLVFGMTVTQMKSRKR